MNASRQLLKEHQFANTQEKPFLRDLKDILKLGISAPSAGNRQIWRIVVIRDSTRKRRLVEAVGGQGYIEQAPVALVIVAVPPRIC